MPAEHGAAPAQERRERSRHSASALTLVFWQRGLNEPSWIPFLLATEILHGACAARGGYSVERRARWLRRRTSKMETASSTFQVDRCAPGGCYPILVLKRQALEARLHLSGTEARNTGRTSPAGDAAEATSRTSLPPPVSAARSAGENQGGNKTACLEIRYSPRRLAACSWYCATYARPGAARPSRPLVPQGGPR